MLRKKFREPFCKNITYRRIDLQVSLSPAHNRVLHFRGKNPQSGFNSLKLSVKFQWRLYSLEGCIDRFYQTLEIPIASPFLFARISLPLKIPQIQTIPASNRILPSPTHSLRPNLQQTQPSNAFTLIAPSKMA